MTRIWRVCVRFQKDERGAAFILVAIMLPAIIGFSLLVIDWSRAGNLHNDLQKAADSFALAAASELDGKADSWTRAERALESLVDNTSRFSNAGLTTLASAGTVTIDPDAAACRSRGHISWCFLDELPGDDSPVTAAHHATTPQDTRFIDVFMTPTGFSAIFPASFMTGNTASNTFNVGARAVAGFTTSICDVTPMFMCNPFEKADGTGKTFADAFAQGLTYSREFKLLKTDAAPGPGNFGLLETDLALRTAFAIGNAGKCYLRTAVETKPGVTLGHVNAGLNVRFDVYSGSLKQYDALPAYRPASNVRKGAAKSSNCNKFNSTDDTTEAMGFPLGDSYDSALGMSSSTWDRTGYWALNHHPATAMPTVASLTHPTSTTAPPSRYDVYRYEIANGLVADKAAGKNNGENGVPQCYKGNQADITNLPDRRLFNVAVVNCIADATKIAGRTELRPDAYASLFLTNPIEKVDKTANDEDSGAAEKPIRLEVVDVEGPMGNGSLDNFLRDEAQLYR